MIDDLVGFAAAAVLDVEIKKAAKRHRWIRILWAIAGLLLIAAIVGLIFLTFWYS